MIFRASNGAEILDKIEIDEEKALIQYPSINHALVIVKCEDDYLLGYHKWRDDWETFGGLREEGVFDALEKSDTQWGDKKVENSKFVFYVSKNSLVQKEKETKEKSILKRWKGKKSISLCCTESELYYIEDMRRVGRIQLENEKTQQLITYEMLEKAGYTFPDIFGMVVYSGHIYLQISGLDVIECGQNGEIGDKIAQDVRYGAFCGNSFFYRRRSSDEIIRFDLESKKEAVMRKKKYKEHVQYNRIFTVDNKLYYELEGEIYLYDEAGNDVKIGEEGKDNE